MSVTVGIGLLLALVVGFAVGLPLGWIAAAGNASELDRWRATTGASPGRNMALDTSGTKLAAHRPREEALPRAA